MSLPLEVLTLAARGALFVVNHSGGKDSQCMYLTLRRHVPDSQIIVVHAHLPEVEWDGVVEHIEATTAHPLHVVQAGKTFFEMVERRQMWPSPATRQCTSDLKRSPIETFIRRYLKAHPAFNGLVVNCMGLRADESPGRAKKQPLRLNERNSKAGREWYDLLPIHELSEAEVFDRIAEAGQEPHWAYGEGMTRLSCCFCIMSSEEDLRTAGRLRPCLARRYIQTEYRLDHTIAMPVNGKRRFLADILGEQFQSEKERAA